MRAVRRRILDQSFRTKQQTLKGREKTMKTTVSLTAIFLFAIAAIISPTSLTTKAQTRNQSQKFQVTETLIFPNECTNELMDISDTTTVTCHDQQRADGTFNEKCEIRQDVTAIGETTGITWHGAATFKDETVATDACNFSFSNRGKVHLISPGSDVNVVISFDEFVRKEDCIFTADQHLASFDCRSGKP
jgi:hypothetical protein